MVGWAGMICALSAFALVATGRLRGTHPFPLALNVVASLTLGYESFTHNMMANLALNAIWGSIAVYSLLRFSQKKSFQDFPSNP